MDQIPPGPRPSPVLIAEATKRSGIVWIRIPGHGRPHPAWHIWRTVTTPEPAGAGPPPPGAAYILTGPGEQPLPGLGDADRVTVTVRGSEAGGAVLTWTAAVSRVEPGGAEWDRVIGPLVAARLNAPPAAAKASPAKRWAREGAVFRLTPVAG